MNFLLRTCLLLFLFGFGTAAPGRAQGPVEIAAEWGLLGTWAVDCAQPPSRQNSYLSFVRDDNHLVHRRDFGDANDEHIVTAARQFADGKIEVVIDLQGFAQTRTVVFAKEGEGRKRAVSNRDDKGVYSIRDGKFVLDGRPAPAQSRCATLIN